MYSSFFISLHSTFPLPPNFANFLFLRPACYFPSFRSSFLPPSTSTIWILIPKVKGEPRARGSPTTNSPGIKYLLLFGDWLNSHSIHESRSSMSYDLPWTSYFCAILLPPESSLFSTTPAALCVVHVQPVELKRPRMDAGINSFRQINCIMLACDCWRASRDLHGRGLKYWGSSCFDDFDQEYRPTTGGINRWISRLSKEKCWSISATRMTSGVCRSITKSRRIIIYPAEWLSKELQRLLVLVYINQSTVLMRTLYSYFLSRFSAHVQFWIWNFGVVH